MSSVCTEPCITRRAADVDGVFLCWWSAVGSRLAEAPQTLLYAQVRQLRMPDARSMYGSTTVLNRVYGYEKKRLGATLREMLFRNTPSARR